jgi:hypothetical protein
MNFKYFWLDISQFFLNFHWVKVKKSSAVKKKYFFFQYWYSKKVFLSIIKDEKFY